MSSWNAAWEVTSMSSLRFDADNGDDETKQLFCQLVQGVSMTCKAPFVRVFGFLSKTWRLLAAKS